MVNVSSRNTSGNINISSQISTTNIDTVSNNNNLTISTNPIIKKGEKGDKGDTGTGIASIILTSSVGLTDTYTIYYTDGTTTTYTVVNGEKGDKGDTGEQGIQGIQGEQGEHGANPVSLTPIAQEGYDITYRLTFSDSSYYDFVVTNGTGSMKWLKLNQTDWVQENDVYKYTSSGSYSVVAVYKGDINSKQLISNIDVSVQGSITYLYSQEAFDGYALIASVDNAEEAGTYTYEQEVASDTWEIEHNLNTYPVPTIVDSGGNIVVGSENYVSKNKIVITFAAPFTGKAYLNYTR